MAASGSTPGGLPYPTTNDRLADTPAYIGELADAAAVRLGNPGVVLFKRQMNTDGNGESWQSFPTLMRVDGAIAQMVTGTGKHTVYASVARLDGAQSVQFRFASAPIETYSAAMTPWANGSITVAGYAWGAPAAGGGGTPLPRPARTDLAEHTDVHIRRLAEAIDAGLGQASKVALLAPDATATTDAGGVVLYYFPSLGQVAGAIVTPLNMQTANGNVTNMPPIPPASIGRLIPGTAVSLSLLSLGVGHVQCRAMTTSWDNGVYQGQTQQYGSQPVKQGVTVPAAGIAWGGV